MQPHPRSPSLGNHVFLLGHALFFAMVLCSAGCIRFTSSYATASSDAEVMASDEEFFALDRQQERRLAEFLRERRTALGQFPNNPYFIGVGDVIDVNVVDAPELGARVEVDAEGSIDLPVLGRVRLKGLSEDAAREELVRRYQMYLKRPDVMITVAEYQANTVSVLGEVGKPGNIPLQRHHVSLLEVLSQAGGRTSRASARVTLIPAGWQGIHGPNSEVVDIDIDDLTGTGVSDPISFDLIAGDAVMVPEAGSVQVDGDVVRPGSYPLAEHTSILGAIAAAGGLIYSADVSAVEVIRELGDGKKVLKTFNVEDIALKGAKDVRLRNADVVRVPSTTGKFVTRQVAEVFNRILNLGFTRRINP